MQQPEVLDNWQAPPFPPNHSIEGQYCILQPLDAAAHVDDLWQAYALDTDNTIWGYLPYGPFANKKDFYQHIDSRRDIENQQYYAIVDRETQKAVGFIAYLRIQASAGSIEIGCLTFSPLLQKTRMATEAVYLLINNCIDLGYRRCEWKCNSLNEASKKSAARFGFQYEGCFRQAMVVKGKNRDTCWYSIIDKEWPQLKGAYHFWLEQDNFDQNGKQLKGLQHFIRS